MIAVLASMLVLFGAASARESLTTRSNDAGVVIQDLEIRDTQACNNYAEFCNRQYSNITEVCTHNSPFYAANNIASNQVYDVVTQLNDGVRMLEGQTHMQDGILHYCHTSCALLDAGTVEAYLKNVSDWLQSHPNEVVTILIANGDNSAATAFVDPIQSSGLGQYVYTPSTVPMTLNAWPTLGELIQNNHRAIIFMDYGADQNAVPYILDQYSQLWETPYSPTDANFPCTINRPAGLSDSDAKNRLYLTNHNLNVNLNISGLEILIPDLPNINRTNGESGFGSLGLASQNCATSWGRPPNFLVVDYYNYGSPSDGSVFEVAAQANGVTYSRSCCGQNATAASTSTTVASSMAVSSSTSTQSATSSVTTMSNTAAKGSSGLLIRYSTFMILLLGVCI